MYGEFADLKMKKFDRKLKSSQFGNWNVESLRIWRFESLEVWKIEISKLGKFMG